MRLARHPDIRIVMHEEPADQGLAETAYSTHCLGVFFDDAESIHQPTNFRHVGLHRTPATSSASRWRLVSGFAHPTNELMTPYRVINLHACNGCRNGARLRFDHTDFLWCPRHGGVPRQLECTRLIAVARVIAALKRIPGLTQGAVATAPTPKPVGDSKKRTRS